MYKYILFLLPLFLFLSCAEQFHTPPPLDPALGPELKSYIETHKQTPADYVVSKFADHDVVIMGEYHRVKENVELIQELIPRVYGRGVRVLATEFARREDQPLIDSLLNGASYNESLAREITFNQFAYWGFQEYVDIFKAAWQFNQQLPDTMPRFRILGMNDSPDWSYLESSDDRNNPDVMKKVWQGGGEDKWAKVVTDAVADSQKVLVYCGIHHGFTSYEQPIVNNGKFVRFETERMGNYVKDALGDRVMTVYLHAIWPPRDGYGGIYVYAAEGQIDALFKELGPNFYPVGFDLHGTPFGKLGGKNSVYSQGYDSFTISQFADGWIFQCPISQYHGVTPIENFINGRNFETAKRQSPNPSLRKLSMNEMNNVIANDAKQAWWLGRYE
ncbi:MAG: ChaN family lipoprotein [Calditrichaeota bacterium]|nr:ChaN family lipoprotein [Calditrichota bacterium]MCB9369401.1 ChaN family lipoprotein [Calditrichota bacterium]